MVCNAMVDPCEREGDIRWWRGPVSWRNKENYLQLCTNNSIGEMEWRYVCDSGWGETEAKITCKQLGYIGVTKIYMRDWYEGIELESITDIYCYNQNATRLVECSFNVSVQSCIYVRGLKCEECKRDTDCESPGYCRTETGQCQCTELCLNGGVCRLGACQCVTGFTGLQCENCYNSCRNGSECEEGYYGENCESKECLYECQNSGTCLSNGTCSCVFGYSGEFCEKSRNNTQINSTEPITPTATEKTTTIPSIISSTNTSITWSSKLDNTTDTPYTTPSMGINLLIISGIDMYTAGWIMMALLAVIILVLCCCHFFILVPFLVMKGRERRSRLAIISTHEPFYESLQTVASYYQIQTDHPQNNLSMNWRKSGVSMNTSGDYTEMKLVYDNRDIMGEEVIKKINREMREKKRLLFENSNDLYVPMNPVN
ncbi:Von Willebrand factor D and EGF domain-containing protein-like [Oopsacas minuta]|uniref:von Willebrand factor D and EGF domain-containing protein-like n=1 Tax=Oopsacas minuta TaxID=111878 RepID=A0AAV7JHT1_9METZ|nr:Von Willebrand factor D and EGF domain-containing protein-like [Oopsacas minuta]